MEKYRPPPKTTYEGARELVDLEKSHENNQRQAQEKLNQVRSLAVHHVQTEKSLKTLEKQSKILEETEKALQFDCFRANPTPKAQVKENRENKTHI